MGSTAALVLQLAIAAMQHATELNQLLVKAATEGRDVTPEELAALRASATSAIDALEASIKAS